jgi:hypothetical protein
MFFQFDQDILVENPDISFGKCHYYCIFRLTHDVLMYCRLLGFCDSK